MNSRGHSAEGRLRTGRVDSSLNTPCSWIWHQKFGADKAVYVGSYYNISNEAQDDNSLFVSSFDGKGPFQRKPTKRKKIGF